jgi:ATP-dependent DNA ligase
MNWRTEPKGHAALQRPTSDLKSGCRDRLRYHVLDLLYRDGFDLTGATLLYREFMLARLVTSFATTEGEIAAFVGHAKQSLSRPSFA